MPGTGVPSTGTMSAARWPAIALPPLRRPGLLHVIVCWGITDTVQVLVVDVRYNHDHRAIREHRRELGKQAGGR